MAKSVSIVIPAYNEEKRIGNTLKEYYSFFKEKKDKGEVKNFEILIVLNACKDNTIGVVREYQKKFKEIKYLDFKRGGKGFAIIEGFKDALIRENDLIGFVDADMATPPSAFFYLIKKIDDYDGAIASRGLRKSIVKTSFSRKMTNKGFNFIVRLFLFLPYKDTQCGAKIFKRNALIKVINKIGITKWAFDVDLLYKLRKNRFKIKEIPTVWYDKEGSKIEVGRTSLQMFLAILRLRLINSPFRFIIRLYNKFAEKFKIHKD